ncbi:MAG: FHIPEP family type III secretion protein [Candidatus Sericytochromatia bacterium]|nr:FHIPEP family type III secretion protein [Candidatus Sericytochromatia bacterium]
MPVRPLAPLHAVQAWLDEHPGARLAAGLALFVVAVAAPLPGWLLDLWVLVTLGGAAGLAALIGAVGDDLRPGEVLATIPGFLRRFLLHKLALSVALLKAVLLGTSPGALLEWVAQGALHGNPGVGLVVLVAIMTARVALATFPFPDRLSRAQGGLQGELARIEALGREGRLPPSRVAAQAAAAREEAEVLLDGRQVYRLLRAEAWLAAGLAAALLGAVLTSAVLVKGWSWPLAAVTVAPYALGEAVLTGLPALVVTAALAQWLTQALEDAIAGARAPAALTAAAEQAPAPVVIELGRDLAGPSRRALQELALQLRTGLTRDLGLPVPRLELSPVQALPARGFRVAVRGVAWTSGLIGPEEPSRALIDHVTRTVGEHADELLSLEACRAWLDELGEAHPVTVALALEAFGLARVQGLLQALVRERVPVRDLAGVLEAMLAAGPAAGSDEALLAAVRRHLSLAISLGLADTTGTIRVLTLAPEWTEVLAEETQVPVLARELVEACRTRWAGACGPGGGRVALVVPASRRRCVASWLRVALPDLAVVAPEELSAHHGLQMVGTVHRRPAGASTTASVLQLVGP